MPSSYTSETIRNNKPRNVLTPHAANEKVFKAGLRVPSTFRTVRSHTKQERMPEISPLADSTADLQPCKQIPSGIRSVLRPFFLLSSHTLFRHSILRCIRLQWLPHLQRPSHILHLAFSALLCPPRFSLNAPHLPSPATRSQAPFSRRTLLLLPGACKYLQTFPTALREAQPAQTFTTYVAPFSSDHLQAGWPPAAGPEELMPEATTSFYNPNEPAEPLFLLWSM